MNATQTLPGITIVALKSYVITGDKPFSVYCMRPDGSDADIRNTKTSVNRCGKYMISFETVEDAKLFINNEEVSL